MPTINFKLSDSAKHDAIFSLLNSEFNNESGGAINYAVCDIYDDYAICFSYETGSYERVHYTKDDKSDSVSLGARKKCYIVDVTEEEKSALETIQALNGGTYEAIDTAFKTLQEEKETFNTKIEEKNDEIATLTADKEKAETSYSDAQSTIGDLKKELEDLNAFKLESETKEKEAVLDKYSKLGEEVIDSYKEKLSEYSVIDLEKELSYELVKSNPSVFSLNEEGFYPKDDEPQGIEAILSKYEKRK